MSNCSHCIVLWCHSPTIEEKRHIERCEDWLSVNIQVVSLLSEFEDLQAIRLGFVFALLCCFHGVFASSCKNLQHRIALKKNAEHQPKFLFVLHFVEIQLFAYLFSELPVKHGESSVQLKHRVRIRHILTIVYFYQWFVNLRIVIAFSLFIIFILEEFAIVSA